MLKQKKELWRQIARLFFQESIFQRGSGADELLSMVALKTVLEELKPAAREKFFLLLEQGKEEEVTAFILQHLPDLGAKLEKRLAPLLLQAEEETWQELKKN